MPVRITTKGFLTFRLDSPTNKWLGEYPEDVCQLLSLDADVHPGVTLGHVFDAVAANRPLVQFLSSYCSCQADRLHECQLAATEPLLMEFIVISEELDRKAATGVELSQEDLARGSKIGHSVPTKVAVAHEINFGKTDDESPKTFDSTHLMWATDRPKEQMRGGVQNSLTRSVRHVRLSVRPTIRIDDEDSDCVATLTLLAILAPIYHELGSDASFLNKNPYSDTPEDQELWERMREKFGE